MAFCDPLSSGTESSPSHGLRLLNHLPPPLLLAGLWALHLRSPPRVLRALPRSGPHPRCSPCPGRPSFPLLLGGSLLSVRQVPGEAPPPSKAFLAPRREQVPPAEPPPGLRVPPRPPCAMVGALVLTVAGTGCPGAWRIRPCPQLRARHAGGAQPLGAERTSAGEGWRPRQVSHQ